MPPARPDAVAEPARATATGPKLRPTPNPELKNRSRPAVLRCFNPRFLSVAYDLTLYGLSEHFSQCATKRRLSNSTLLLTTHHPAATLASRVHQWVLRLVLLKVTSAAQRRLWARAVTSVGHISGQQQAPWRPSARPPRAAAVNTAASRRLSMRVPCPQLRCHSSQRHRPWAMTWSAAQVADGVAAAAAAVAAAAAARPPSRRPRAPRCHAAAPARM